MKKTAKSLSKQQDVLLTALDAAQEGIIILDKDLNATFMNRAVRALWKVADEQADSCPSFAELVSDSDRARTFDVPVEKRNEFIAKRIERARSGDPRPQDIQTTDGRHIRAQCAVLPDGGRMLTYWDITDLIRSAQKLERLATTDPMTGLSNRRQFFDRANDEWERYARYQRPLSVLLIDVDRFKSINDRFGHGIGDIVLAALGGAFRECKRGTDIIGRIGGDEFAVLLPETDLRNAGVVAKRIAKSVKRRQLTCSDSNIEITISVGAAEAVASMSGAVALLAAADQALYEAKAAGRNCIRSIDFPMKPLQRAAE